MLDCISSSLFVVFITKSIVDYCAYKSNINRSFALGVVVNYNFKFDDLYVTLSSCSYDIAL